MPNIRFRRIRLQEGSGPLLVSLRRGRSGYTFTLLSMALARRAASSLANTPGSELNYRRARPRVGSQVLMSGNQDAPRRGR
jgi:hypothetical protein